MNDYQKDFEKKSNLKLLSYSSVWNFHNVDHLTKVSLNKNSNLHKGLQSIKNSGYKGALTLLVTRIGRSQHSASTVAIYRGQTNINDYDMYYSKRCVEVFIR